MTMQLLINGSTTKQEARKTEVMQKKTVTCFFSLSFSSLNSIFFFVVFLCFLLHLEGGGVVKCQKGTKRNRDMPYCSQFAGRQWFVMLPSSIRMNVQYSGFAKTTRIIPTSVRSAPFDSFFPRYYTMLNQRDGCCRGASPMSMQCLKTEVPFFFCSAVAVLSFGAGQH